MTRRLRYLPETISMVEVTNRTIGSMFLLKPSKKLEKVITGIIGRGQRMYPVLIHSLSFVSNHCHLLSSPGSSKRLAELMGFVNGNIAKQAGRLAGWRGTSSGLAYRPSSGVS